MNLSFYSLKRKIKQKGWRGDLNLSKVRQGPVEQYWEVSHGIRLKVRPILWNCNLKSDVRDRSNKRISLWVLIISKITYPKDLFEWTILLLLLSVDEYVETPFSVRVSIKVNFTCKVYKYNDYSNVDSCQIANHIERLTVFRKVSVSRSE